MSNTEYLYTIVYYKKKNKAVKCTLTTRQCCINAKYYTRLREYASSTANMTIINRM